MIALRTVFPFLSGFILLQVLTPAQSFPLSLTFWLLMTLKIQPGARSGNVAYVDSAVLPASPNSLDKSTADYRCVCASLQKGLRHHIQTRHENHIQKELFDTSSITEKLVLALRIRDFVTFSTLLKYTTPDCLNEAMPAYSGERLLTYLLVTYTTLSWFPYFEILVHYGADVMLPNQHGQTPLLVAVLTGNSFAAEYILETLLLRHTTAELLQSYIALRDDDGRTALWASIVTEQFHLTTSLLDLGARPNTGSPLGLFQPLHAAVLKGDLRLVQRLLDLGADAWAVDNKEKTPMALAVEAKRTEMIFLLLHVSLLQKPRALPSLRSYRHRVETIFNAISEGLNQRLIRGMIELEIMNHNPELCSYTNLQGRTLLHEAIRAVLVDVVDVLISYYEHLDNAQIEDPSPNGYTECYADDVDGRGVCPSEHLIQMEAWHHCRQTPRFLDYLMKSGHHRNGENCLLQALGDVDKESRVFFTAHRAAERYGVYILHLEKKNLLGLDALAKAVYAGGHKETISWITSWLVQGYNNSKAYQQSLASTLATAAGGWNPPLPHVELKANPDALRIIANRAPIAINDFLYRRPILTPSDELAFRNVLNTYSGPFSPALLETPLSQAVRSLMSPLSLISSASLIVEMVAPRNLGRYTPQQLSYALDIAGATFSIPVRHHGRDLSSFQKIIAEYKVPEDVWLFPITGDEIITPRYGTASSLPNPTARYARVKRAQIIKALLRSPLMLRVNPRVYKVTLTVFITSTIVGLIVILTSTFFWPMMLSPNLFDLALDWLPDPHHDNWMQALLEGFRRTILFPNIIKAFRTEGPLWVKTVIMGSQLCRHLCFIWLLFEIYVIQPQYAQKLVSFDSKIQWQTSMYVSGINFVIQTLLSKNLTAGSTLWIQLIVTGKRSNDATCLPSFYWAPQSQRLQLFERAKQPSSAEQFLYKSLLDNNRPLQRCRIAHLRTLAALRSVEISLETSVTRTLEGNQHPSTPQAWSPQPVRSKDYERAKELEAVTLEPAIKAMLTSIQPGWWDAGIMLLASFLVVQYPFWSPFRSLLYFDVYWSNTRYTAYLRPSSSGQPSCRELAILFAKWAQLYQLISPIILQLRLIDAGHRTGVALRRHFPLRHIPANTASDDPFRKRDPHWNIETIATYIDVRQTIFKQFDIANRPLRLALSLLVGYMTFSVLVSIRFLHSGFLSRYAYLPAVFGAGLCTLLYLFILNFLFIRGALANAAADEGWADLRSLYTLPSTDMLGEKSKRIVFQAVKFFQPGEYRFETGGARFSASLAFLVCLGSLIIVFRMLIVHRNVGS